MLRMGSICLWFYHAKGHDVIIMMHLVSLAETIGGIWLALRFKSYLAHVQTCGYGEESVAARLSSYGTSRLQ